MKTLAFLAQKGGSGKTTLSVHTAVAAHEAGEQVVVVDTDPQKSASVWYGARSEKTPAVVSVSTSELQHVLKAAKADKMTWTIIDTAPHASPAAAQIARGAGLVVIPCRPTALDLAAAKSAASIVKAARVPAVFVLSACPPRAPEVGEARAVLTDLGFPVAPVEIGERRAFARAVATGQSVTEFESGGKAAEEIRSLWAWLKENIP
jgi:chromosome partitioning protein